MSCSETSGELLNSNPRLRLPGFPRLSQKENLKTNEELTSQLRHSSSLSPCTSSVLRQGQLRTNTKLFQAAAWSPTYLLFIK